MRLFIAVLLVTIFFGCKKEELTITDRWYPAGVIKPIPQCGGRLLTIVEEHPIFQPKPNQWVKISIYWRYSPNEPFLKGDGLPKVKEEATEIEYYREALFYDDLGNQEVWYSNRVKAPVIRC